LHCICLLHILMISIRSIAICNDAYKFTASPYSILQKFAVDNKAMVTSHLEAARKLHAWRKDFDRALKRIASLLLSWIAHGILVSTSSSARMMRLALISMPWSSCQFPQLTRHGDQLHLHIMVSTWCIRVAATTTTLAWLRYFVRRFLTRQDQVSPTPGELWGHIMPVASSFSCLSLFWVFVLFVLLWIPHRLYMRNTLVKPIKGPLDFFMGRQWIIKKN